MEHCSASFTSPRVNDEDSISPSFETETFSPGNYFTEFGGQETYDRSLYPKEDWQLRWIEVYLTEYSRLKGMDRRQQLRESMIPLDLSSYLNYTRIFW